MSLLNRIDHVILLDRDGVINIDLPGSVLSKNDLAMIEGVGKAVATMNSLGFRVMIVTNQACVGRNELSESSLKMINAEISAEIAKDGGVIDDWFICTHTSEMKCECRKPLPGLLLDAANRYGFDLKQTWFVGDSGRDIEAALAAGAMPALVLTGKGCKTKLDYPQVPTFKDLNDFATVLAHKRSEKASITTTSAELTKKP